MAGYLIESAQCGMSSDGMACGPVDGTVLAEVKVKSESGSEMFITLAEVMGIPSFFRTIKSIYKLLESGDFDADDINPYCLDIGEYDNIFENRDAAEYDLYRYLIYLVRSADNEAEQFISCSIGKHVDEIEIPVSDVEQDYIHDSFTNPESKDELYALRMALEADIAVDSVFHDMDGERFDAEKKHLAAAKDACDSDREYTEWKERFLNHAYAEVKDQSFLTCTYIFAGMGQYEATMPAEKLESFRDWINGNGSAFMGEPRAATEEEIKHYLACADIQ